MDEYLSVIILCLIGTTLVMLLLFVILWIKQKRMRANYLKMLNGNRPENMEQLLIQMQEVLNRMEASTREQGEQIKAIQERIADMKARVGVYRYNAFAERGNDLSFSIAIVNDRLDGVVLSGIHNREETYMYAKPLERGDSKYMLTPEEREAINRSST